MSGCFSLHAGAAPLLRAEGELVGSRYLVLGELAHGGMCSVYRALDRLSGRVVSLKRLRTDTAGFPDGSIGRLELAHEFQLLASLRHPNIIGVLDYGFDDRDQPFLTMELTEGASTILDASRGQRFEVKIDLLVQTLRAIAYVHHRGIFHRDIKPSNILVHDEQVKLLDFGLSFRGAGSADLQDTTAGTLAYLAPELLAGAAPGVASDLFAFGIVMYEVLAGRHPFDPEDRVGFWRRLTTARVPLPADGVDPCLEEVLLRLLARDPAHRFGDASEVICALASALDRELVVETIASRESFLQSAAFTGRAHETRTLGEAIARADAGEGGTWLLAGESGVGKSRLLEEIRCLALVRGVAVAKGQASADGGEPYAMWREVLPTLVLAADRIGPRLASDLKLLVPGIDALIGAPVAVPLIDVETIQARLVVALEELLDLLHRPVVILLEDLQWADSASMKLLAAASRAAPARKVALLGSYRDDELADPAASIPAAHVLKLARLDAAETGELAESMIGSAGRDGALVEYLLAQTEGIPFFLVELLRTMAEEAGSLVRVSSRTIPASSLPATEGTQRLLRRRLARIPERARPLLEVAAVIGREVDALVLASFAREGDLHGLSSSAVRKGELSVLASAAGPEGDSRRLASFEHDGAISSWCTECAAVGIFSAAEDRYRFSHDKLREQVLADLAEDRRRSLHRAVAESIERLDPVPDRYLAALAHHWGGAGDRAREGEACERAGYQALESGACAEAARFFQRALEVLGDVPARVAPRRRLFDRLLDPNVRIDPRSATFRAARLETGLTETNFRLGDFPAARVHAQRALVLCGVGMPATQTGIAVDLLKQVARRVLQMLFRFRAPGADSAEVAREMVKVQSWLYEICFFALEPLGLVWSVLSMTNHCGPLGPSPGLARAHMALALIAAGARLHPLARRWGRSSISIARQVCSKSELGYLLNRVNNDRFVCCDWETADRGIAEAAALAEEIGDVRVWEEARSMQGMSALFQGRFEAGLRAWSEAHDSCLRSGNVQIECWSLLGQADNLARLGRYDEAVPLYHRAIERLGTRAHATESIWAKGMLALACLHTGDDAAAEKYACEALDVLSSTRPIAYWTQFGTAATCEVFLALAEVADEHSRRRSALVRKADRARRCMRDFARAYPMGRPFRLLIDGRYHWLTGRRRLAIRRWKQCIARSRALGTPYELACASLELSRCGPEDSAESRRHFALALATFRRCGVDCGTDEATEAETGATEVAAGTFTCDVHL
jgi:tetratricopeptide (TPR) repeat protein